MVNRLDVLKKELLSNETPKPSIHDDLVNVAKEAVTEYLEARGRFRAYIGKDMNELKEQIQGQLTQLQSFTTILRDIYAKLEKNEVVDTLEIEMLQLLKQKLKEK